MKKILTHIGIIIFLLAASCIYFMPILQGKALVQGDTQKYEAMAKAQKDYHKASGEYSQWCPSMFSGMPGYQITNSPQQSLFTPIKNAVTLYPIGRHNDIGVLFLYLIGFYVALSALGLGPWLALFGALAFGLGSYNIIIIEAGHISKGWAMAMMAPILAGMLVCFKGAAMLCEDRSRGWRKLVWGGILFLTALGLQIAFNHIQITFYTALAGVLIGIVYAIWSVKDKMLPHFLKAVAVLVVGVVLALACNARHLLVNKEYMEYTMRGGSELTASSTSDGQGKGQGLDLDYAFAWSYGIGETYTILVPGARGGGSIEKVDRESACYQNFHQDQMPLYWGDQPFTSGPVYFGAIVVFLFILGLFVVKGPERWWLLIATLLAIVLSWGRNLIGFNGWVFEHLPLYNKFRTPSMSLVLANVLMVLMAVLALREVFAGKVKTKSLLWSAGITVAILLGGMVLSGNFSYTGAGDQQMAAQYGDQWDSILGIFMRDRKSLFIGDSWRSLIFVLLAAALLCLFINQNAKKAKKSTFAIPFILLLTLLSTIDLWGVDRRYLNDENYVRKASLLELKPDSWDYEIDKLAAQYGDQDYRVLNLSVNTFNDSKPSAFHNQIGGYSAAKLRRYQDIIDHFFNGQINPGVLNMLNGRYVVYQGQVQRNPDALGSCWLADSVVAVGSPDDEIQALATINTATTAVIDTAKFALRQTSLADSSDGIMLAVQESRPDYKKYTSHCEGERLALFSEIHYAPDWKAYIDGQPAEYIRANYILRGMYLPAGDHVVEFVNEAPSLHKWDKVTLICSFFTLLVVAGALFLLYRKKGDSNSGELLTDGPLSASAAIRKK